MCDYMCLCKLYICRHMSKIHTIAILNTLNIIHVVYTCMHKLYHVASIGFIIYYLFIYFLLVEAFSTERFYFINMKI